MPIRLTKAAIAALEPRDKAFIVYDSEVRKLGVRITPAGSRAWTFEYRAGGGRRSPVRRLTLGKVDELTPEAARRKAKQMAARVLMGSDPARDRNEDRSAPTVAELADKFMAEEVRPMRKPGTAGLYAMYFRVHVLPALGKRRAQDVTQADVARLHRAIGRDARPTANRAAIDFRTLHVGGRRRRSPKGHQPRQRREQIP